MNIQYLHLTSCYDWLKAELGCDFIITGSLALHLHGLIFLDKPKDLDLIILKPTEEQKAKLNLIHNLSPSSNYPDFVPEKAIRFRYRGIDVDVFYEEKRDFLMYENYPISLIPDIIAAKKRHNRAKDLQMFSKVAIELLKPVDKPDSKAVVDQVTVDLGVTNVNLK